MSNGAPGAAGCDRRSVVRAGFGGGHRPPLQDCWRACFFFLGLAGWAGAADEKFGYEFVRERARALAARPYAPAPKEAVPEWLRRLSYDEHRIIEFDAAHSLWRRQRLPFQVQFFHPGYIFNEPVQIAEVRDGVARPVSFRRELFDYRSLEPGPVPETLGFAGFKLLYDLNRPNDELGAFLGASYFRLLCQGAHYGLSARGLALNTAELPGPEEFPRFTEFWLERPERDAKTVTVHALLDSESVTGAYRFEIAPGAATVAHVKATVFARKNVRTLGAAPLTSMFWRGENSNAPVGEDFRPEVHDSDGLLVETGTGEWIWRPLQNPKEMRVVALADENPRGFGLLQRDRAFDHYRDLEAHYHLRPSAWVEPVAGWGKGSVRLAELPTRDEYLDNIVAFWTPEKVPPPGEPLELEYRLHWLLEMARGPGGAAVATYHHRTGEVERFLVEFAGPALPGTAAEAPEAVVTAGGRAEIEHVSVQRNSYERSWRVTFTVKPDAGGRTVELRCFLRRDAHALTETWSYLWQP